MAGGSSPKLTALRDALAATTASLHRIAGPLDDATWRRAPGPGRWSAAECVQHLNMSSRAMLPRIRESVGQGRARGLTRPAQRLDLMGWFLVRSLEPPAKSRFKTNEDFTPPSIEPKEQVIREWDALQRDLVALLGEMEGLTLTKIKVTSPFSSRVKYNAYSAVCVIAAHQRRHLWQAENILAGLTRAKGAS